MQKKSRIIASIGIVFLLLIQYSCKDETVNRGIYHWQSTYNPSKKELSLLDTLNINSIYIKLFDIDWSGTDNAPIPVAKTEFISKPQNQHTYIPVIFITNRTLSNSSDDQLLELSGNIYKLISNICSKSSITYNELQLDCDWTQSTADKYFTLIKNFRNHINSSEVLISSTIRLHQIKFYGKTGVPPVDKGMLMVYNIGDVSDMSIKNSIIDIEEFNKYLYNFDKYPLQLDIALPAYSWGAQFRDGKLISLINNLTRLELENDTNFTLIKDNTFLLKHSKFINGSYAYKNDLIRVEASEISTITEIAEILESEVENISTVSLYHLNPYLLENYEIKELSYLFNIFK